MKQEVKDQIKSTIENKKAAKEFIDYIDEMLILLLEDDKIEIDNYYHQAIPEGGIHIFYGSYNKEFLDLEFIDQIIEQLEDYNQPPPEYTVYCGTIIIYMPYFK